MKLESLKRAVEILRAGGLVAFPTETVYGLGADATNSAAVRRIFDAKGRPSTNPLIVHVADEKTARRYAAAWPSEASGLALRFWPGPLTLVLAKAPLIVPEATPGRYTVALRVPDHPLTLALLREFDGPVAAPSANRSMRISPTTAEHVRQELGDTVDLILDGGPCRVGIESTVLDLSGSTPTILRPGGISREQIERIIGPVDLFAGAVCPTDAAASPGQHPIHYAPRTPAYRFEGEMPVSEKDERFYFILLGKDDSLQRFSLDRAVMPNMPDEYAHHLYSVLREADTSGKAAMLIELPPDEPQWLAVRDRLTRATRPLP